ncbi:CYIR protein [Plasmodium cynomolgi strain B]|uniref:CYIR protein n=1 Tax=Plasmodium cynomolgi (strain B) TaxID=1120755 RepID=K6UFG4_PLACD|nr:CYIR protein [Plasmodium cynomolgi strain B]GAB70056.1 CYIR protein [Plasmodium cynomolgi strain B]
MIHRIREQQVGPSSYNIKLKECIVIKWSIRTIVMCLILCIGLIIPILSKINNESSFIPKPVRITNAIIFIILTHIILFSMIYTMIKVVKFHRLEAGKGKLNFREYDVFCKDTFLPKRNTYKTEILYRVN